MPDHFLRRWYLPLCCALASFVPLHAADVPVVFDGQTLFSLSASVGSFSPADRASAVAARLTRLSSDRSHAIRFTVVERGSVSDIVAGGLVILSVTDADASAVAKDRKQLASDYAHRMQNEFDRSRSQRGLEATLLSILLAVLATAVAAVLLRLLRAGFGTLKRMVASWAAAHIRSVRIQRFELIPAERIRLLLVLLTRALAVATALALVAAWVFLVLSLFPWTRGISVALVDYLKTGLSLVVSRVVAEVPNLVMIVIIAVITRYVIKLCRLVFTAIGKGHIAISGFYPEWADPTYKIARFLILAFAAVVVFPYFPGHDSPAFRGISIFVGVLFSLGSAGAVGNIVAGVLLTYTRAFQVGDRVRIADTTGDVLEKTLLVTRIRTIKNEDVTVPNSLVLGSHTVNFSACAVSHGLILHTTVTIGYDAPWRKVHQLLVDAALATPCILPAPAPFVLQTGLDDFYVSYQINAYTSEPLRMAVTYSELHKNIQDKFNEAGVEICSPHFAAVRDANRIAIPPDYVPDTYVPPAFRVQDAGLRTNTPAGGA